MVECKKKFFIFIAGLSVAEELFDFDKSAVEINVEEAFIELWMDLKNNTQDLNKALMKEILRLYAKIERFMQKHPEIVEDIVNTLLSFKDE